MKNVRWEPHTMGWHCDGAYQVTAHLFVDCENAAEVDLIFEDELGQEVVECLCLICAKHEKDHLAGGNK